VKVLSWNIWPRLSISEAWIERAGLADNNRDMGAFNTLKTEILCINCNKLFPVEIQFKFGFTRQLEYQLHEKLIWTDGENKSKGDIGTPNLPTVNVYGIAENAVCPHCSHFNMEEFDIRVEYDVLKEVNVMKDYQRYLSGDEGNYYEI